MSVPLYKGDGDKNNLDNYRFLVLLSACNRIIARIIATRLATWSEQKLLLTPGQWGFRKNRSTQDALFCARILCELAAEVSPQHRDLSQLLVLVFIDITKAYTRVQRDSAWLIFKRLGMPDSLLRVLRALHEGTSYRCRSRLGLSDSYEQQTGFREGCCTSPVLYNLFHSFPLKDFDQRRKKHLSLLTLPDTKPFNLRMHKQCRSSDKPQSMSVSLVVLCR